MTAHAGAQQAARLRLHADLLGEDHPLNDAIYSLLTSLGLIDPLTEIVASMSQALTFIAGFALLFSLLAATALPRRTTISGSPVGVVSPTA